MKSSIIRGVRWAILLGLAAGWVQGAPPSRTGLPGKKKVEPYPLEFCVVTGDRLDEEAVVFKYRGQEVKLCCQPCRKKFLAEPKKWLEKMREEAGRLKKP